MKKTIFILLTGVCAAVIPDAWGNDVIRITDGIMNIVNTGTNILAPNQKKQKSKPRSRQTVVKQESAAPSPFIPDGSYVPPAAVQWSVGPAAGTEQSAASVSERAPGQQPPATPGQAQGQQPPASQSGAGEQVEFMAPTAAPWKK